MQPATDAILDKLPIQPDGLILDLACGLGTPTFDAARRNPGARVLGADRAEKVIEAARASPVAQRIENVGFEVMSLDALSLPDRSVDAAVSEFGFLQEGDVAAPGLRERLLREAGISPLHSEPVSFDIVVPSAAAVWAMISEPVPYGRARENLADDESEAVRDDLLRAIADLRESNGAYRFPIGFRLFWGRK